MSYSLITKCPDCGYTSAYGGFNVCPVCGLEV